MKFDTVIIGGGLSGLTAGISLAKAGKTVAVISAGRSTLHFNSGSFDLIGYDKTGTEVLYPRESLADMEESHPYSKVDNVLELAEEARQLLLDAGIRVKGDTCKNHYRITPMGVAKPTWLTIDDFFTSDCAEYLPFEKILLVNIAGFLDFPVDFISEGLERLGSKVYVKSVSVPALKDERISPSKMRSAGIARLLTSPETIDAIAAKINLSVGDSEVVLLPAILGLKDDNMIVALRDKLQKPMYTIATLPPSVPGMRVQTALCRRFEELGGTFLLGSTVTGGVWQDNRVVGINCSSLPEETIVAKNYILATGSFQSHGIVADFRRVYEPIFDIDVDYEEKREAWTAHDVFDSQPYMSFGVRTDPQFRVFKDNQVISNVYAVGSVLSGHDSVKRADAAGVSMLTALAVSKKI